MARSGRGGEGLFRAAIKWFTRGGRPAARAAAHDTEKVVLRRETENSLSNLEDAVVRNPETLRSVRTGDAFSGVYRPESGKFLSYHSVDDPLEPGAPVNAVHRYGGHGDIDDRLTDILGTRSDQSIGFTMFAEPDGFSVGWRSRSVNRANYGTIEAPERFREPLMRGISQATGRRVWSR